MADTETKPAEKIAARNPLLRLKQNRMHPGESRIRWWCAEIEEDTPYEALFDPVYWDVHGYKFQIGDFILARPDEGHYTAQLLVVGVGAGGTKIEEFYRKDHVKVEVPATLASQYRTKWAGPHHKWRVERIADNHVEHSGFDNETAANIWLADNLKALSRNAPKVAA
jgi:hypothetical protein